MHSRPPGGPFRKFLMSPLRLPRLLTLTVVLLLAAGLSGCAPREPALDFRVSLFDGSWFSLADQHGKSSVVLNFWYPSCAPCRQEMPHLEQAWRDFQDEDVRFVALFVPRGFDSEQDARDFVDEYGLTFNFATDRGQTVAQQYGIEFYPTTYFIDRDGKVARVVTRNMDLETIVEILESMGLG